MDDRGLPGVMPNRSEIAGLGDLEAIGLSGPGLVVPLFSDEPKYPSHFFPTPSAGPYRNAGPYGLSLARSAEAARLKALAELYERLCLHNAFIEGEPRPYDPSSCYDPSAFASAGDRADAALAGRLRNARYRWMPATGISRPTRTLVPAQVVVPDFACDGEPRVIPKIGSSGCALGRRDDAGAWQRGLFEVIERHTAADFRVDDCRAERIVDLPAEAAEIEANLRRYRLEPYVFRLTNAFGVPCVAVALVDPSGVGPALSIAMRAAPTWQSAIAEGILESLERRRPARLERARGTPEKPVYPWSTLERLQTARPAMDGAPALAFASLDASEVTAALLLDRLEARGLDVLQVDLTLPEVAAAGFEAVKVLVPGLGPLPA